MMYLINVSCHIGGIAGISTDVRRINTLNSKYFFVREVVQNISVKSPYDFRPWSSIGNTLKIHGLFFLLDLDLGRLFESGKGYPILHWRNFIAEQDDLRFGQSHRVFSLTMVITSMRTDARIYKAKIKIF